MFSFFVGSFIPPISRFPTHVGPHAMIQAHHISCFPPAHLRCIMTAPPRFNASEITIERYHHLSDTVMNNLLESLENLLDELGDPEYEVEYQSGVLTLRLGASGTYVINKQPPNKQIWLSSPFSGPKRYDYSETEAQWRYLRDGRSMSELLNDELTVALGQRVQIHL